MVINNLAEGLITLIIDFYSLKNCKLISIKLNLIKVTNYIHDNISEINSINELCLGEGVPERSLRRLITDNYQISPKAFLNKLRLNEVNKSLKLNHDSLTISEVANDYNFWDMGQFSHDYKKTICRTTFSCDQKKLTI
jgi:AraC-like DNA-binding protein